MNAANLTVMGVAGPGEIPDTVMAPVRGGREEIIGAGMAIERGIRESWG